jgi:hypothetical protein
VPIAGPAPYNNGVPVTIPSFATGSDNLSSPPISDSMMPELAVPARRERSAPHRVIAQTFPAADLPTIPVTRFGERITAGKRLGDRPRRLLMFAIGGVALVVVAVVALIATSGKSRPAPQPAAPPVAVKAPPPVTADPSTGFDLYVTPTGITQWKLDGESRTDRLPSRIRGISAGPHTVQIEPPPGFLSHHQQVAVELGKAPKVEIALQPIPGLAGVFESTPPGATVSLIVDGKRQEVGPSPARAPLDPRSTYQVLFEKPGYVSVNRPITFSGALEEHVVVNLESVAPPPSAPTPPAAPTPRASPTAPRTSPPAEPRPRRPSRPAPDKADRTAPDVSPASESGSATDKATDESSVETRSAPDARARAQGILVLGSKPPCDIAIDGIATNLHTPQKEIKLSVGRHRVTLTNSEFGISETFAVDIKADAPEKLIKDYSDRLPN